MTYSIIAKDETTGQTGIAVASRFFACGAIVPYMGKRTAVASQAFCNPMWGVEGLARLEAGEPAAEVLADFIARDGGERIRQAHMLDLQGGFAAHTGADCVDWCGHLVGDSHSVAGNMLTGPEVVQATFDTYAAHPTLPLADRLMLAMKAGEAAGGDKRGRQAAGLRIHDGQGYAILDLRADDHADPLTELQRLLDVSRERYYQVSRGFATEDNFSGLTDRAPIDAAIRKAEADRAARGIASRSHASDTGY